MADPLSISSAIIAVLQFTGTIIAYLKDINDAAKDRIDFLVELSGLHSLLNALQKCVELTRPEDPWLDGLRLFLQPQLAQFESTLKQLKSALEPPTGLKKRFKKLTWKFNKLEIKDMFSKVERIKLLTTAALTNSLWHMCRDLIDDSKQIKETLTEMHQGTLKMQQDNYLRDITNWLSPFNFQASQRAVFRKREEGTGQWLLESTEYRGWCDGISETLWCQGIPGAGKTILASIVIDHLKSCFTDARVAILCIFCNYKDQSEQSDSALMANLLKQTVVARNAVSVNVRSLYEENRGNRPPLREVIDALKLEIETYLKVFIVVDALDEFSENKETRSNFLRILRSELGTSNLMITSRDPPSIAVTKCLSIRATADDVRKFIEGQIDRGSSQPLKKLKEDVVNTVVEKAGDIFLLAQLHIDSLAELHTPYAVRQALQNLPASMDTTYEDAMKRIKRQKKVDEDLAMDVLSWITHARRSLSIEELQHAIAADHRNLPNSHLDLERIVEVETILSVCACLVVIDREDSNNFIKLIHATAHDYFERNKDTLFPDAHTNIARTCLTYLSFDVFGTTYRDDSKWRSVCRNHALLPYVLLYWGCHAFEAEESMKEMVQRFLQNKTYMRCAKMALGKRDTGPDYSSGLHVLLSFGMVDTIQFHLENGAEQNIRNHKGQTPLSVAAERGHPTAVNLLLAHGGVDVNNRDQNQRTPLLCAAARGHVSVVKLLVADFDVDVNSKDAACQTPLVRAASDGHELVARLLMERPDVEVDSKDIHGQTALFKAAKHGHGSIVRLLMARNDVDINSRDAHGQSPLSWAARQGHEEVVKLLLTHRNIDINQENNYGQTPLSLAVVYNHTTVLGVLLTRDDIDLSWKDGDGRTVSLLAAEIGHDAVLGLLIERGVQVDSKQTWLSLGAEKGHVEVVKLLVTQDDVDVNSKDVNGRTPLLLAASEGHLEVVEVLLNQGDTDVNSKDDDGRTPISWTAERGHGGVAQLLLAHDRIDVNSQDFRGQTPLLLALCNQEKSRVGKRVGVVKLLAEQPDIDVNLADAFGQTPLSVAAGRGYSYVVTLLMTRNDVDVNLKDRYGRSPLSLAAENGHARVVKRLMESRDVDINSKDINRETPLSLATKNEHTTVIKLLTACGDSYIDDDSSCDEHASSFLEPLLCLRAVRLDYSGSHADTERIMPADGRYTDSSEDGSFENGSFEDGSFEDDSYDHGLSEDDF